MTRERERERRGGGKGRERTHGGFLGYSVSYDLEFLARLDYGLLSARKEARSLLFNRSWN